MFKADIEQREVVYYYEIIVHEYAVADTEKNTRYNCEKERGNRVFCPYDKNCVKIGRRI